MKPRRSFCGWIRLACLCCALPIQVLAKDFSYKVNFDGLPNSRVKRKVEEASTLIDLRDTPPASMTALRQRAESDKENILNVLKSYGYYNAEVDIELLPKEKQMAQVQVQVKPGELFRINQFRLFSIRERPGFDPDSFAGMLPSPDFPYESISPKELGVEFGGPAKAKRVLKAKAALIERLEEAGYPFATVAEEAILADRMAHTLSVTLYVNCGPIARFGSVKIQGLETVSEEAVRKKLAWTEGERFDPRKIRETWLDLQRSQLFSAVHIQYPEPPDNDERLPILVVLRERQHRSVELGVSYDSHQSIGVLGSWTHRNIRGEGERITLEGDISPTEQAASVTYVKPDFLTSKQDLLFKTNASHLRAPTFSGRTFGATTTLRRQLTHNTNASLGFGIEHKSDTRTSEDLSGLYLTIPASVHYSNVEHPLDAQRGVTLRYDITHNARLPSHDRSYTKQMLTGTTYLNLTRKGGLIWANKLTLGSIIGASLDRIQVTDRFHAGSDRLLRGYRYLSLSPPDSDGRPSGGRSIWVASSELRMRPYKNFGLVAFADSGVVSTSSWPQFDTVVYSSVGIGLRYHTSFGPLRVDFAFPLRRRLNQDRSWEYYVSFGQAF